MVEITGDARRMAHDRRGVTAHTLISVTSSGVLASQAMAALQVMVSIQ